MTVVNCPMGDCKHRGADYQCTADDIMLSFVEVCIDDLMECDAWELNKPPFTEEEIKVVNDLKKEL